MNKGIELLLKRMDSHPQEFTHQTKWDGILIPCMRRAERGHLPTREGVELPFLSDEDVDTLIRKYHLLEGEDFTRAVLETLVRSNNDSR